MKVLLVATNRERSPYPVAPLGTLCAAAAARAGGHEVISWTWEWPDRPKRLFNRSWMTAASRPSRSASATSTTAGLSCPALISMRCDPSLKRSGILSKARSSSAAAAFPCRQTAGCGASDADCGVVGEGERAFPEVLTRLEAGRSLEGIEGVITAPEGDGAARVLPTRPIERLAELPPPAHDLCGYAPYLKRGGFVGVQTKRGCPLGCTYCVYPKAGRRRYRLRPPEDVVREIETVAAGSKLRHFFFVDSVFNDPRAHALAVCTELARRKLPVRWNAFCNPLGFDAEVARAMAQAGCSGVEFGLDVATPRMLAALGKPFGQEEIRIALQAARDAGLPFAIYLLFGGPAKHGPT